MNFQLLTWVMLLKSFRRSSVVIEVAYLHGMIYLRVISCKAAAGGHKVQGSFFSLHKQIFSTASILINILYIILYIYIYIYKSFLKSK